MSHQIKDPGVQALPSYALFEMGFRPFFLLAGVAAVMLIFGWALHYAGLITYEGYYSPLSWHSHEMLFGYVVAVMSGFLLTAVRNWPNQPTPTGVP